MTVDEVALRFEGKRSGSGYVATCPAHQDREPSLSINSTGNRVLVHCFAGCDPETVVAAVGLTLADLFDRTGRSRVVATHLYRDLQGVVLYRKTRTADKKFAFARPDGHGGWIKSRKQNAGQPVMTGVERQLYRRDELVGHTEVFIAEGEKDADRLWSIELPATTNDGGAGKWTHALTAQLTGVTDVWIFEDNDAAGREHAELVARSCTGAGIRAKIVRLPGLPEKGDVSDFLDAGHSLDELLAACQAAGLYAPAVDVPGTGLKQPHTLDEVHAKFTYWLGIDYDLDAIDAVLATAAAGQLDGDPIWLLLISGSGNAKTETVQSLAGVGALVTSTISSVGALLSGSPKKETASDATGGLLRRVGARGVIVIKDVTSILSMHRDSRIEVLAALREVHDGRWERNVGVNGGKTLTWTGRIVIIGAVTTAWDTAHSVIATMGDRFVLLRMDSHVGRESAGRHAIGNTGREIEMRNELAGAVAGLLMRVDPQNAITVSDADRDSLLAAANATTLCRTACEYDYRGDPIEAHAPEMPTRFAKQLTQVVRGGVAIGMDRSAAMRLAIRCARDSIPPLRLAILEDVFENPGSQPNDVRTRLNKPWSTVKRQLQSLYLLQVLTCEEIEDEKIEVEDEELRDQATDATTTKKTIRKKKTTTWRYRVADSIDVAALRLIR